MKNKKNMRKKILLLTVNNGKKNTMKYKINVNTWNFSYKVLMIIKKAILEVKVIN